MITISRRAFRIDKLADMIQSGKDSGVSSMKTAIVVSSNLDSFVAYEAVSLKLGMNIKVETTQVSGRVNFISQETCEHLTKISLGLYGTEPSSKLVFYCESNDLRLPFVLCID